MDNTETLINLLQNIGSSIREKTGKTDLLTLQQMPSEILSISEGGDLTFDQVLSRNYDDLTISDMSIVLQGSSDSNSSNEQLNQFLLRNSTFNNLYIENLQLDSSAGTPDRSSFIYKSKFNSLTINNFILTNGYMIQSQKLFFDNNSITEPTQSLRINNFNYTCDPFYFNCDQPLKCLFLNLNNIEHDLSINDFSFIKTLILTNDTTSTRSLVCNQPSRIQNVYCSNETNPTFQQFVRNTFTNVQFISNQECENLWDTEITTQL